MGTPERGWHVNWDWHEWLIGITLPNAKIGRVFMVKLFCLAIWFETGNEI